MSSRLLGLTIGTPDPTTVARFWSGLLGREADATTLSGSATQVGLRFVEDARPVTSTRVHLHVTSDHAESQDAVVAHALALGATHIDVGQLPDGGHVVLADPDGTAFCVIEQGNSYLAGTGVLGELACDGTRDVGLFWSEALGWPLVWDQDEETAIQSPDGGTKIAWGGPPVEPHHGRDRERLELATPPDRLEVEVERLVGLGATAGGRTSSGIAMFDPDGNEFSLGPA